MKVKKRTVGP